MNESCSPLLVRTRSAALTAILLTGFTLTVWAAVAVATPHGWIQQLDDRWHDAMAARAAEPWLQVARTLAATGSAWVTIPVALLVAVVFWRGRDGMRLRIWAGAVIPAYAVTLTGKLLYARPRPSDRLVEVPTASFPSGHSTDAAVFALTLVLLLVPPGGRRRPWLLVAVCYALLMAWSRTYLRVHWLSDVTAGACWGAACALWSTLLLAPRGEAAPESTLRPTTTT